jgi:PAS domain S-box-containing protein
MTSKQADSAAHMHLNRLTLAFCRRYSSLEQPFQDYYFHNILNQMRIGMATAFIFYGLFGIMDAMVMDDGYRVFWVIRWAMVCPCILAAFVFSYSRYAFGLLQVAGSLATLVAGLGIIAMAQLAATAHSYVGGLVQIIFFIFTFSRLRFIWAAGVTWILIAAYVASAIGCGVLPSSQIMGHAFHLILIGLMGTMAGYAIEYRTRRNFFLSRQLISKKRRLHLVTKSLEERVSKRTLELKSTNQLLREKIEEGDVIQAELWSSHQRFRNIFEAVSSGMIIVDGAGCKIVDINPAAAQMIGENMDHLKGKALEQLIRPADAKSGETMALPMPHPIECLLSGSQGNPVPVIVTARNTEFEGRPHWIVSFNNIQKIKEAEAAKRQLEVQAARTQHLQAIGTMAGGIAHDFNNILFGMLGYTELALEDAGEDSVQAKNLKEVLCGGYRAKEIIHQILTFSRQESVEKRPVALPSLIKETLNLLRVTIPATIVIDTLFAADAHKVQANPTRIHQVIVNLCTNAAGAIGDRPGHIRITLDNKRLLPDEQAHKGIGPGDFVRLAVEDDGMGIRAEIIDRIFEPFFTSKAQGQGTGMGLAVVLGIVQDHKGVIGVESQPGKGARFEILLPACINGSNGDTPSEAVVPAPVKAFDHIPSPGGNWPRLCATP